MIRITTHAHKVRMLTFRALQLQMENRGFPLTPSLPLLQRNKLLAEWQQSELDI